VPVDELDAGTSRHLLETAPQDALPDCDLVQAHALDEVIPVVDEHDARFTASFARDAPREEAGIACSEDETVGCAVSLASVWFFMHSSSIT
jgi:hypothetical protein